MPTTAISDWASSTQTRTTHRRPAFLHVLQKPRHERPGSVVVGIRIRRVDRLTVLEHGPDRDRSAESEFEVVPGPEQTRDFVVRDVRCAHDVVDEPERARVLGVDERGREPLRDAVDDAEQEERERVRGEGDAR